MTRDPQTPQEWQEAVDLAEFHLAVDSARQYGLIDGGPTVNAQRCVELLKRGSELGFRPAALETLCRRFMGVYA